MSTFQEKIDEIMDYFDFHKVHRVMEMTDWKWADGSGGMELPDVAELRKAARQYLRNLEKHKGYARTGSGGFHAELYEDGNLRLSFSLEDWQTEEES